MTHSRDQLYERLAPEWRETLRTGAYLEETDCTFYRGRLYDESGTPLKTVKPTVADILSDVASEFGISRAEIIGRIRAVKYYKPRAMAALLVSENFTHLSTERLGAIFNKDRTTIANAIERAREFCDADEDFAATLNRLRNRYE